MLDFTRIWNYYIACGYTDMRKQIDGLVSVVEMQFGKNLDEESIFLFCGRQADRIKALYWDGTGYIQKSEAPEPLLPHSYASASVVTDPVL